MLQVDAILPPIAALELTFGVLGDLCGRKKLAIRTAVAFILLSGLAIFLFPVTSFLMARLQPRWVLTLGFALMGAASRWRRTWRSPTSISRR